MPGNDKKLRTFLGALALSIAVAGSLWAEVGRRRDFTQIGSGQIRANAFRTVFRLTNENPGSSVGQIRFFTHDGSPLNVAPRFRWSVEVSIPEGGAPEGGRAEAQGNRVEFEIPSGHSLEVTLQPGEDVALGRARLDDDGKIFAQAFLQFAGAGLGNFETRLTREVESRSVEPGRVFSFPISPPYARIESALAFSNLSGAPAEALLEVNSQLSVPFLLQPGETVSGFLRDLLGGVLALWDGQVGDALPNLAVFRLRSAAPLSVVAFRTAGGLPLSGVGAAPVQPEFRVVQQVQLGGEFELGPGESAEIAEEDLEVGFWNLTQDSRCPTGLACVDEGQAEAVIRLRQGGRTLADLPLVSRGGNPARGTLGAYTVELLEVSPYPTADTIPLRMHQYRVRLRVDRSGG